MFFALAVVLWGVQIWNHAQAAPQSGVDDRFVNIKATNAKIDVVLSNLGSAMKLDVIFDDSVKDRKLTIDLRQQPVRKATETILEQMAFKAKMKDDHTLLIFADTPENRKKYADLKSWM
jgi:hypothetical protein